MSSAGTPYFGWAAVARLGLVQACLGAVVVMTTSTLNRVMVVELMLPAMVPGLLVALHYALQLARPRMGHGSDVGGRRTPWILGGQIVLAAGGVVAALATAWMGTQQGAGLALAVLGFSLIGLGVSACGTSLLVLLAKRVAPERRAAAATLVWVMMIMGFAVTAGVTGKLLDPYTPARLVAVMCGVSLVAVLVTVAALWRLEGDPRTVKADPGAANLPEAGQVKPSFTQALRLTWADTGARRFTIFVFVSMLAYSAQDLILEPFAGVVFSFTPGQSTSLSGVQHGGVLLGMLAAGLAGNRVAGRRFGSLRAWMIGGCMASAMAMSGLVLAAIVGPPFPLSAMVFMLGAANGAFSIAAIGSMMKLASADGGGHEGVRMGVWGAAQGIAFGSGGFLGTVASDLAHGLMGTPAWAYGSVFALEALLFLAAAALAYGVRAMPGVSAPAEAGSPPSPDSRPLFANRESTMETFDVVVVGGGPAGATAAQDLARAGRSVLLLDRSGRIKPCGGAIPPRAMLDFDIPESMLVARARCARMVSPTNRHVDIPIEGGYVGLVDREQFDEWLRERARAAGADRRAATFEALERDADGAAVVVFRPRGADGVAPPELQRVRARTVIGADGARSEVARQSGVPGADKTPFVFAYHEILKAPAQGTPGWDPARCDVVYRGSISPDFYGWVFPHGDTLSVGTGSADKGFSLRNATQRLRRDSGLEHLETIRREGAPIPLKPLPRWDNGRDVVLAGDASGVVAPASGEGIYYAMTGGRYAADAVSQLLNTGDVRALKTARKRFMREHGRVFWVLGIMQRFWYCSDKRRERFVAICEDRDVQQLTFDAYMNKRLVRSRPMAHVRIFFKDMAHLLGLARV